MGTQTHLPLKFCFSSDFGLLILKILESAKLPVNKITKYESIKKLMKYPHFWGTFPADFSTGGTRPPSPPPLSASMAQRRPRLARSHVYQCMHRTPMRHAICSVVNFRSSRYRHISLHVGWLCDTAATFVISYYAEKSRKSSLPRDKRPAEDSGEALRVSVTVTETWPARGTARLTSAPGYTRQSPGGGGGGGGQHTRGIPSHTLGVVCDLSQGTISTDLSCRRTVGGGRLGPGIPALTHKGSDKQLRETPTGRPPNGPARPGAVRLLSGVARRQLRGPAGTALPTDTMAQVSGRRRVRSRVNIKLRYATSPMHKLC